MDHVAIMNKSWKLIPKILDGRKRIESRWGVNKCAPWGKVKRGDRIFFKNSGEPITVVAKVSEVKGFQGLDKEKVRGILEKYGGDGGISVSNIENSLEWAKNKRYCTLIYLETPKKLKKQFDINKTGFGTGAAWIVVPDINKIRMEV